MTGKKARRPAKIVVSALTIFAVVAVVWVVYQAQLQREMRRQLGALVTLHELRQSAVEDYLQTIRSEILLYTGGPGARATLRELVRGWRESHGGSGATLRRLYASDNPYPPGERHRLDAADDGSRYSRAHAAVHPRMVRFLEHHGYYDLFVVAADGSLVYTVAKEDDFGTNLVSGPWRDTGLGRAVRAALQAEVPGFIAFTDFESYEPSAGEPASFISSPVFDPDGTRLGALAFQVPTERLQAILQFTAGMGRTGETYLVGADYLMRSDSRFSDASTILSTRVETDAARRALSGETGAGAIDDYRDVSVLSAFGPMRFEGVTWALIAEIDEQEARRRALVPRRIVGQSLLVLGAIGGAVALVLIVVFGRQARPRPWTDVDPSDREVSQASK